VLIFKTLLFGGIKIKAFGARNRRIFVIEGKA
jgi:hypothetical protein